MTYKMNTRRKLAIASWSSPSEGNIYGKASVDMTHALRYIEYLRATTGEKITITHLVGRAVSLALKEAPDVNGRIFLGKYRSHDSVDMAFLVALEDGHDLAKVKLCNVDQKRTVDIARELRQRVLALRDGKDDEFNRSKPILRLLPTWLIRPILWSVGYLTGAMGLSIPALGLEKYPFGAAIVTSVGMLGLDEAFAPPTPFARVPVYIVVPAVKDRVVAEDGQAVIRPYLDLMATIDHRFLDGFRGAVLGKMVRKFFEEPWVADGFDKAPWTMEDVEKSVPVLQ
jgi:pyruvate/2-oxoglutarate dehydrogenase complex dihydrolipoamide acyltransferase (E2) component